MQLNCIKEGKRLGLVTLTHNIRRTPIIEENKEKEEEGRRVCNGKWRSKMREVHLQEEEEEGEGRGIYN